MLMRKLFWVALEFLLYMITVSEGLATNTTAAAPTPVPTTITATTTVSCSSGRFITRINLSAGSYVDGITSIRCSDGVDIQVSPGLTGTSYTAISGDGTSSSLGYCSYRSGLSSTFVTQLKFVECTGGVDGTYGTTSATLSTGRCPTGQKAVGLTLTQGGGFLTSFAFVCGTIERDVSCSSGNYITEIILHSSDVVYGISSITCSDGSSKVVNTGVLGGGVNTASSSGGYCMYSTGLSGSFITQLTLGECTTSVTDGPFGSNTATVTTHGCSSSQKAVGVKTTTGTALTSFSFACAAITTAPCYCADGAGDFGPPGCYTSICKSCDPGYALLPLDWPFQSPICFPTTVVKCAAGAFITALKMIGVRGMVDGYDIMGMVNGITSIKCSDGLVVSVNAGRGYSGDTLSTAIAGDGSSGSPGYCASSMVYTYLRAYSVHLTECTGGVVTPFEQQPPDGSIFVTKACGIGEKAIGVETTVDHNQEYWEESFLEYFSFVCGPIP